VIDGLSDDGTANVIEQYADRIDHYRREKDRGIYDALNKGIRLATGDIVGVLHADDFFAHQEVLSRVVQAFEEHSRVMGTYGDLIYVDSHDTARLVRTWRSGDYQLDRFRWGWMPPHPTVYLRRECYERFGVFRDEFHQAADYELLLRMMFVHRIQVHYIPETLVCMRVGGKSNATLSNRIRANREDAKAWIVNGIRPPVGLRFLKPFRKLRQFLTSG
jgi:glycosyltransferase